MRWVVAWGLLLLLLVGLIAFWGFSDDSRSQEPEDLGGDAEAPALSTDQAPNGLAPAGLAPDAQAELSGAAEGTKGPTSEQRTALESQGMAGRVVDEAGQPIVGASLSWTALTSLDRSWEAGWQREDWGPLPRSEVQTESDGSGAYRFESVPELEPLMGSVIWATAPGYAANCLPLGLGEEDAALIVLERAEPLRVRVVDRAGNPLAGVLVEQFGLTPSAAPLEVGGRLERQRLRRLLRREARSGKDGRLELAALPGEQVLRAREEARRSLPWRGSAPAEVTLRLEAEFSVGGEIELPDWSYLNYEGERRLLIGVQEGDLWRGLATLRGVEAGPWGPVRLPILEGVRYSAKLEGSPIIPITHHFVARTDGQTERLDFSASVGSQVTLCGLDESDQLVPDITATVWWDEDGVRQSITRRAPLGSPYANPWSMPPGDLYYSVSAPGYAPGTGGPISLPELQPAAHPARLRRAGRLEGRVSHQGQPLEDFELFVWLHNSHASDQQVSVRGSQGGRFSIDTAPLGQVAVSASSGHLPPSRFQLVTIRPEQPARVELELEAPSVGVGRVVDMNTGRPLMSAQLSVSRLHGGLDYGPLGLPQRVGALGAFRLENLLPGPNLVRVSAPGYAPVFLTTEGVAGEEVDCGSVSMTRSKTLELRLVSSDPALDLTQYAARIPFPRVLPLSRFPGDGRLRCPDATAGNYAIQIMKGGAQQATLRAAFFPGEPWELEHRVGGGRRVEGKLIPSKEVGLDQVLMLSLLYSDQAGVRTTLPGSIDAEGAFVFEEVHGEAISVSVLDHQRGFIGQASGSFDGAEVLQLNPLLGSDPLEVLIQDAGGNPLPQAGLSVREVGGAPFFNFSATNANGLARLYGLPQRPLEVFVQQGEHGYGMFALKSSSGERTYALEKDSSMRLRVYDGEVPLEGARVAVSDAQGERMFAYQSSAADGQLSLEGYSPGRYRLLATHPHCWPVFLEANANPSGPLTEVQLRRLGNLQIYVTDAQGEFVKDVRLKLWRAEDGADVHAWIAEGRVRAKPIPDGFDHSWEVHGLPHGEYAWAIGAETGKLVVKPLATRKVSLVLGG